MRIGPWTLPNNVLVAPMAGVTDRPFRQLCKKLGAGYAVSEMAASNPKLWDSVKTSRRLNHDGEIAPISVQIAGADPAMMAEAAVFNAHKGARIIDINMGCPVKKVCNVASGSALLRHEDLIARILDAVVEACAPLGVPVTLKTRTGWDRDSRNALRVARRAQDAGIAALTLHGRTRADLYTGEAEYDTIRAVRAELKIPLIANGDIDSPEKARRVLDYTGADAVMIGRAAQGRPWIFREVDHYLRTGETLAPPSYGEMRELLLEHLDDHYRFYGEHTGVRTARKHIGWYLDGLPGADSFRDRMNLIDNTRDQWRAVSEWFLNLSRDGNPNPAPVAKALLAA
ncbi:tRNA dihydrouridine synthase DusB [Achromobacter ruhlandii]|uniref:tRNA-dihydrouridine synthase B n=1 Tax=Achromobacter ruhlandii TaxID=72557 RepID=A0ABM8LMT1_9BURK|nr:tRNA dihydrouridine synthase DusB [Achromobacter ruhlandii]AKP88530.1 tRNA dihydrouridine synthase B [Achromobacter xylosoxidans]MCZ8431867.1 tRNA dihydrouridine synthase DusB [Achromobacter ruhlandii]MDC6090507.1 tRNA dihydrouridine synthase DusB [Achromobacter ruhlandii]MDC6149271.1 tRNA dihydrouridine synthase DusB [Achromobacter ruhlandii]MDD7977746.1 tRNA dihydrouridine synthase DusB [Achromobacter ruhlandii]